MQNPPPAGKSSTGLDENIAALLSYVFGWVSGLIFFLIEKDSRFVRFHAMQSILFNALIVVVAVVLGIGITVLVFILGQLSGSTGRYCELAFVLVLARLWPADLCRLCTLANQGFQWADVQTPNHR
jgi:uncharacterized membrane protein